MNRIHYLDPNPRGSPPVLLLHGLGVDATSWTLQMPVLLEAGLRPIAPDMPGFGKTVFDGHGWSISACAAAAAGLLDELGLGSVHLVGISMGAAVALRLALDYATRVQRLVLVSAFARLRPQGLRGWLYFALRYAIVHTYGLRPQARLVADRLFPRPGQEIMRRVFYEQIAQADVRVYRAAMRALARFDVRDRLGEMRVPTLVVSGDSDTTVPLEAQRELAEGIPLARHVILPGGGHALTADSAEAFNQVLLGFLHARAEP